jgi:putative phage-type endonuclease
MSEIIQGSPEWLQQRLGKATASRIADIVAKTKKRPPASRANYLAQLVAERLTNQPTEGFKSPAMQHGTETEPLARMAYEMATGELVTEVPMIDHPTIPMSGASPDGLVGKDGLVEIKCPNTATHIETLIADKVPTKYIPQIQWQIACTGRAWCDFVSYDPRMPEDMQLFVKRVERDDALIAELEGEVTQFLEEVTATVLKLIEIKRGAK